MGEFFWLPDQGRTDTDIKSKSAYHEDCPSESIIRNQRLKDEREYHRSDASSQQDHSNGESASSFKVKVNHSETWTVN